MGCKGNWSDPEKPDNYMTVAGAVGSDARDLVSSEHNRRENGKSSSKLIGVCLRDAPTAGQSSRDLNDDTMDLVKNRLFETTEAI